ncbi:MAG: hypothetical protein PHR39_03960 [Actinomycetota bacterium]|nr:hypothetical protein [Actinomycetota bacterium]
MNNTKQLSKSKLPMKIFFFEKTPFMGVELLDILKDYSIVFYNLDQTYSNLKNSGFPVISYGDRNLSKAIGSDKAVRIMLQDRKFLKNIIVNKENARLLFFYMDAKMDNLCKKFGSKLILPPYNLQEKLGNKLFLNKIIKAIHFRENKCMNIKNGKPINSALFQKCVKQLDLPFILQGGLGVSGEDTFLIKTERDFYSYTKKFTSDFRASKFIRNNIPFSVHVCITNKEILCEGPFLQIIGFPELSTIPFMFCGNDTNQTLFTNKFKLKIRDISLKIAEYVKRKGYKGILGIDYLWDTDENEIYVQELNTRLVGLTRLLTGIQKTQGIIPHLLQHINTFIPVSFPKKYKKKNIDISKRDFSQIYIANNKNKAILIKQNLVPGIYKFNANKLKKVKSSLFLKDLTTDNVLVNYTAYQGSRVKPGGIIAKIILKKSSIQDGQYLLTEEVKNVASSIRNFLEAK